MNFLKFFLDPFNIFWILLFITAGVYFLKKDRLFNLFGILVLGWLLIISTPLVPGTIINSLEDRYEPLYVEILNDPDAQYHIIVLGGGHGFDDRLPANSLLSQNALGRLNEGIRLHRELPNSKLILSGFSSTPGRTTQAEMLQKTAILLGVDKEATILQNEPGNTYEEGKVYSEKFRDKHKLIVVTNAYHMPRAIRVFEKFGIEAIPSPTNFRLKGNRKHKWVGLPSMFNIGNLKIGIYEYVGMLWYELQ